MTPFRLVILVGCLLALAGGGYVSYTGLGLHSYALGASPPSVRTGSPTGGGGGFIGGGGRIK